MSELYSITGATLRGIADAIRQKLRISEPVDAGRFDEYVAAFPTREMLDIQYDQNGTMLLVRRGLQRLSPLTGRNLPRSAGACW